MIDTRKTTLCRRGRRACAWRTTWISAAALVLLPWCLYGQTTDYSQDFDDWPGAPLDFGSYSNADWMVNAVRIRGDSTYWPASTNYAGWFDDLNGAADPWVRSPLLTNGVGAVAFALRSRTTYESVLTVETSTNGSAWQAVASYTNADPIAWVTNTCVINTFAPTYVRIRRTGGTTINGVYMGIDDIAMTLPYPVVSIAGTQAASMLNTSGTSWQGVVSPDSPLSSPAFRFESNRGGPWGDNDPSGTELPVYGTADTNAPDITISGTVTNHLAFLFDETTLDYSIRKASYVNFDAWTGASSTYGTYTNDEGWVLVEGRINSVDETSRALVDNFAILKYDQGTAQVLRSPRLTNGIGTISFWYRNWKDGGSPAAGFTVQKSEDGQTGWVTVSADAEVSNITTGGYAYFSANVPDRQFHYVRILNNKDVSSWLCLDEVIVTEPGASVYLSQPFISTNAPVIGNTVQVSIDATPTQASNLECRVYFRPDLADQFDFVAMTPTNGSFVATLPPTPNGAVHYYFECTYDGFKAGPTRYPAAAPLTTLAYTNSMGPSRSQDFDDWSGAPIDVFGTYTDSGWTAKDAKIRGEGAYLAAPPTNGYAAWLNALTAGGDPMVVSPVLTNGVSTLYFRSRPFAERAQTYVVESSMTGSTNPADWSMLTAYTNSAYLVWATNVVEIDTQDRIYLRIRKTADQGQAGDLLGIDNISISYPPAGLAISNVVYSPGYPSTNDNVTIYARWYSTNPEFPAFGFNASLCYRYNDGPWMTNDMSDVPGQTNQVSLTLPAGLPGQVEYYIKGDFRGYYHTYEAFTENQSPSFSPEAPLGAEQPTSFHDYVIRAFESDYDRIEVTSDTGTAEMSMIGDNVWLGVLDVENATNSLSWTFSGIGEYGGQAGVYSTNPAVWGDDDQPWSTIPLFGNTETNGTNVTVNLGSAYQGQIVFVVDLLNGTYQVKRCAFQNFNTWRASELYFEESLGQSLLSRYENDFNDWNVSSTEVSSVTFDAPYEWDTNDIYYTSATSDGGSFWYIEDALVFEDSDANRAARLTESENIGTVWPHLSQLTEGVNTVDFRYRARFDDHYNASYNAGTAWNNYSVSATLKADTAAPDAYLSMFARYQDLNNYYEFRLRPVGTSQLKIELWRRKSGSFSMIGDSTAFSGTLTQGGEGRFTVVDNNDSSVYLEGRWNGQLRAYGSSCYDTDTPITGAGTIGFLTRSADIKVDDVEVEHTDVQRFEQWSESTIGTHVNNGWTVDYGRPYAGAYCVLFSEIRNALDTFESWGSATNWGTHSNDGWSLVSGRIAEPGYSGNSAQLKYYAGGPSEAYLRTPLQPNGVASVSFRTMHEDTTAIPFAVQTSADGINWSTVENLTSTTDASWELHYVEVENDSSVYVRVLKSATTATNKWLAFDLFSVGKPVTDDSQVTSPELSYTPGSLQFTYTKHNYDYVYAAYADNTELQVLGSANGSTWDVLDTLGPWAGTGSQVYQKSTGLGSYSYFRVKITSDAGIVRVEDFYINSSTNIYEEDFSSGTATDWSGTSWSVDTGTATYDRPGYAGPVIGFDVQWAATNNAGTPYPSEPWQTFTNLAATNLEFTTASIPMQTWDKVFVRLLHTSGGGSLIVDEMSIDSWRGDTVTDPDGWKASEVIVTSNGKTGNGLLFQRSRGKPSAPQGLRSPALTNGLGALSFDYKVDDGPVTIDLELADQTLIFDEINTNSIVLTNTSWTSYTTNLWTNITGTLYLRVRHTSADSNATLTIDNAEITDYAERDDTLWVAYNALVTPNSEEGRKFEGYSEPEGDYKTCYLNNNASNRTDGVVLGDDLPFVQSPTLSAGVGEVSFWYRCWEQTGAPPATVYICTGNDPSPESTFEEWTVRGTFSGITNTVYSYFTTNFYVTEDEYLRIYSETSLPASIACLDNILIGEPIAASLDIGNLAVIPEIPLHTNEVLFSAAVSNMFLSPSNVDIRVYYNIGTNTWGAWTPSTYVPLWLVSDDGATRTYQTPQGMGIPATSLDVDHVVQYFASASYEGLFSDKTSPETERDFVNPAWYEPVDLNQGQTSSIPYFFVYSCPTGSVWINEINYRRSFVEATNEYIELCGGAGTDISGWKLQLLYATGSEPDDSDIYDRTTLPASTYLPGDTNGYGFYVWGDPDVANVDMTFTNPTDQNLERSGAIRLIRSVGTWEQLLSYGSDLDAANMTNFGYEHVNLTKSLSTKAPFMLTGEGDEYKDFTWVVGDEAYTMYSPGSINVDQSLVLNEVPCTVWITGMDIDALDTWIGVMSWCTDLYCTIQSNTNLVTGAWGDMTSFPSALTPNATNWITFPTAEQPTFYRVKATNSP